ncbi:MAG TPA: SPW repeat protein [Candidatus Dormibacteraeota bacterium]
MAAPLVFATGLAAPEAIAAYFLGGLVVVAGLANIAFPTFRHGEIAQVILAVVIFASPWAFAFTAVTGMAWAAWIVSPVLLVVVATVTNSPRVIRYPTTT